MREVPDPIERGEARCEDWAIDNWRDGKMRCCCGKWFCENQAETLSPDPYAIPVCPECFEKAMDKKWPGWREKMDS